MDVINIAPLPNGTELIDADTREPWVVAYCEALSLRDPFCPYAYGCVNDRDDERVVFHDRIWTMEFPAAIWPRRP